MPPMRSRCAACYKAWKSATGASRNPNARKATMSVCAYWSDGARQWSRPTISAAMAAKLAERAVAMARAAPDDQYVGLADPSLLAHDFPDLDLLDPVTPSVAELE